jgi:C4-dicarboxylate transporter, DctM subunit
MAPLLFLLLFLGLLAAGVPIFLVLGSGAAGLFFLSGQPLIGAAQLVIDDLDSPTLVALPLFVMAASFMRFGGVAQALVELAAAWLGGVRGSLGLVTLVAGTLFAAICGPSVATALGEVIRGILPFIVLLLIVLGIITYVPTLTLWLPNAVFGAGR